MALRVAAASFSAAILAAGLTGTEAQPITQTWMSAADIRYLRGIGKQLIWPQKWRPVEHPPPCGVEIDGPEVPLFIAIVCVMLGLGWVLPQARSVISSTAGGLLGIYMSLAAFHILTLQDAPYNGEFCFCLENFLFILLPFTPAAFFSAMVKSEVVSTTLQKSVSAAVMLVASVVVYLSITIEHQVDDHTDHRVWWLLAAQFIVPACLFCRAGIWLLRLAGFHGEDEASSSNLHRTARHVAIQRVLSRPAEIEKFTDAVPCSPSPVKAKRVSRRSVKPVEPAGEDEEEKEMEEEEKEMEEEEEKEMEEEEVAAKPTRKSRPSAMSKTPARSAKTPAKSPARGKLPAAAPARAKSPAAALRTEGRRVVAKSPAKAKSPARERSASPKARRVTRGSSRKAD